MSDDEGHGADLRRIVALARSLEEKHARLVADLVAFGGDTVDAGPMIEMNQQAGRFLRQLASVHAAQALAYDAMIAAGGPDNSRAYVEYEAASQRNTALLPQESL